MSEPLSFVVGHIDRVDRDGSVIAPGAVRTVHGVPVRIEFGRVVGSADLLERDGAIVASVTLAPGVRVGRLYPSLSFLVDGEIIDQEGVCRFTSLRPLALDLTSAENADETIPPVDLT